MNANAVIISIGDELMLGQIADTNAAWLSARLAELGVMTAYHQAVPDDQCVIAAVLRRVMTENSLVIVTGGLGPTPDDLTRAALADAMRVDLELNESARLRIEDFFARLGRVMPPSNLTQAMLPQGARALDNPAGTAPGIMARVGESDVYVLPGVPYEMQAMFDLHLAPQLRARSGRVILTARLSTFGMGESQVAEKLGDLMRRDRNPLVGVTVSAGIVSVRIRADYPDANTAHRELETTSHAVRACLGDAIFSAGKETLADIVAGQLLQRRMRLVTVESCTGGLLGKMLTDIPGASDFYLGGWVVYANAIKTGQLDVPADVIKDEGAVSETVARLLAQNALYRGKADCALADCALADCALAITGIAGPGGGTPAKPVGTVWIALAVRSKDGMVSVTTHHGLFPGERDMIRQRAAKTALNILRLHLMCC